MSVESNLNVYYEELVASMAEQAKNYEDEGGVWDGSDAIWQAIDEGLMYYCDQGYVLAMAVCRGYVNWYKDVSWDEITEMLYSDVSEELEYLKKSKEGENND